MFRTRVTGAGTLIVSCLTLAFLSSVTGRARELETKLLFWHTQDRLQASFLRQLMNEFMASHPGIDVRTEEILDLPSLLLKGTTLGLLPDVVLVSTDHAALQKVLDLSPITENQRNTLVAKEHYAAVTLNGKIFGEPVLSGNHLVFYYNKALMPVPPSTWEELLSHSPSAAPISRKGGWPAFDPYFFLPFLLARDKAPLAGSRPSRAAWGEALDAYEKLMRAGVLPTNCTYTCATEDFFRGKYAFAINGEWAFADTRRGLGPNFGMARLPLLNGKPLISPRGTFALLFPRQGLSPSRGPALRALSRYLQSEHVQSKFVNEAQRFPVHGKVKLDLLRHPDKEFRDLAQALSSAASDQPSPDILFLWPALRKGIRAFHGGGRDFDQSFAIVQSTADAARYAFESSQVRGDLP